MVEVLCLGVSPQPAYFFENRVVALVVAVDGLDDFVHVSERGTYLPLVARHQPEAVQPHAQDELRDKNHQKHGLDPPKHGRRPFPLSVAKLHLEADHN